MEVIEIGDARVRGTFELTLKSEGGEGDEEITLEDGAFDVPFAGPTATGVVKCGIGASPARRPADATASTARRRAPRAPPPSGV